MLIIQVKNEILLKVGALGKIKFKPGLYAYVGSAQSNLEHRIERHLRRKKPLFWHIDYLLSSSNVEILKVFAKEADRTEECVIARMLNAKGKSTEGFGSSDCRCMSHLVRIGDCNFLRDYMRVFYEKHNSL